MMKRHQTESEATRSAVPEKEQVWQSFTEGEAPVLSFPANEVTASFPAREVTASFPAREVTASFPAREATASFPAREATASFPAMEAPASFPAREFPASFPAMEVTASFPACEFPASFPAMEAPASFPGTEAPGSSFSSREAPASAGTERKESEMAGPASQGFFQSGKLQANTCSGTQGLAATTNSTAPRYAGNAWPNPAGEQPLISGLGEAMRHYTMNTSPSRLEMMQVGHSPSYPMVEQSASLPGPWINDGLSPEERPTRESLVLTIIGAFLSLFCCVCFGIGAIVVSIEAWQMQQVGKYEQAKDKQSHAWALIVVAIFCFSPVFVILILVWVFV